MLVNKMISVRRIFVWTAIHVVWLTIWAVSAVILYKYSGLASWMTIPWLPVSLLGTAVAFYVGFKNNSAYDRMWEARKIWGAIVNSSRAWGITVTSFVSNQFTQSAVKADELHSIHQRLIYRHIAWLYALRSQLLMVKSWEHAAQDGKTGRTAAKYQKEFGIGLIDDEITKAELHRFVPVDEFKRAIEFQNTATQLINQQSQDLMKLREKDLIDDFRHMEMQKLLGDFFVHQGKAERIKNFPLPRQYANLGSIFVAIFIFLLPFVMVSEFSKLGDYGIWLSIPFIVLVGWVFYMMESIGDISENPFQGMANDIPMYALSRTIEIDLREMLGETDLPPKIEAKNGILM